MEFGYFTLSDNRYPDNPRTAEQFMIEIRDQAVYAEEIGMYSAWIGEHHFNRRGCVPVPGMVLSNVAALTSRIRLGPSVIVLPIHHPIHVAEEWAALDQLSAGRVDFATGRGYDSHEYAPFGADYQASAEIFAEGLELLNLCWGDDAVISFDGKHYQAHDLEICPKPYQRPFRPYMGSFSRFSMELAAKHDWNIMFAPFAASLVFGGLAQAADAYREVCGAAGKKARRIKCSYFIHMCDTPEEDRVARVQMIDYFTLAGLRRTKPMATKLPPTMEYYRKIGEALNKITTEDLGPHSILLGKPDGIIETLKDVEAAGIEEVMLYFNYGNKPDSMVREQMDRFMREVAPEFHGAHLEHARDGRFDKSVAGVR